MCCRNSIWEHDRCEKVKSKPGQGLRWPASAWAVFNKATTLLQPPESFKERRGPYMLGSGSGASAARMIEYFQLPISSLYLEWLSGHEAKLLQVIGLQLGRSDVRWSLGQEASLAPPCSNLSSLGSKCILLKKVMLQPIRWCCVYSGFTFSHYDLPFPTRYCIAYVRSGLYQLVICVKGYT